MTVPDTPESLAAWARRVAPNLDEARWGHVFAHERVHVYGFTTEECRALLAELDRLLAKGDRFLSTTGTCTPEHTAWLHEAGLYTYDAARRPRPTPLHRAAVQRAKEKR